jgi:hypothetical protein
MWACDEVALDHVIVMVSLDVICVTISADAEPTARVPSLMVLSTVHVFPTESTTELIVLFAPIVASTNAHVPAAIVVAGDRMVVPVCPERIWA